MRGKRERERENILLVKNQTIERERKMVNKKGKGKRKAPESTDTKDTDRVNLNVGGKLFVTTRGTLATMPGTMLGAMFKDGYVWDKADPDGSYFFDRSPKLFEHIMDVYRNGYLKSGSELGFSGQDDEMWKRELTFWGIDYSYEEQKAGDVCIGSDLESESTSAFEKIFSNYIEFGLKNDKKHIKSKFSWTFVEGEDTELSSGDVLNIYQIIQDWETTFKFYARQEHNLDVTIETKDQDDGHKIMIVKFIVIPSALKDLPAQAANSMETQSASNPLLDDDDDDSPLSDDDIDDDEDSSPDEEPNPPIVKVRDELFEANVKGVESLGASQTADNADVIIYNKMKGEEESKPKRRVMFERMDEDQEKKKFKSDVQRYLQEKDALRAEVMSMERTQDHSKDEDAKKAT